MKKTLLSAAVLAGLTGILAVQAQQGTTPTAAPKASVAPKIGLVDINKIFRDSNEFKDLFARQGQDLEKTRAELQQIAARGKKMNEELSLLKKDSPEFNKVQTEVAKLSAEFDSITKLTQVNNQRREIENYEAVYRQAIDVVSLYAKHYNYTLVLRFNSDPVDGDNPQKLAASIGNPVVYHQPQDDITDAVIEYMNRRYGNPKVATTSGTTGPAPQPANAAPRTATNPKEGAAPQR